MSTLMRGAGASNTPLSAGAGQNFGPNAPGQNNNWTGGVGNIIGSVVGGYFGGPAGAQGGGIVGTTAGDGYGNIFNGKDAYNGKSGSLLDNLNPFSDYGLASQKQAAIGKGSPFTMIGDFFSSMFKKPSAPAAAPASTTPLPVLAQGVNSVLSDR
jgi:hypothetical protein